MEDYEDTESQPQKGAPKGNQFWKARTKHGRDKLFASSNLLWESCCEYFQWAEDNPLWENKVAQFQGGVVDMPVAKMRAMTIGGLCIFLDIDRSTWTAWKDDKDFSAIVKRAEEVIYEQKLTGAAADLLNPNIIARELGLRDASTVEHSGSMDINKMTDDELNNKLLALINESSDS
jgi:hypothetical protein